VVLRRVGLPQGQRFVVPFARDLARVDLEQRLLCGHRQEFGGLGHGQNLEGLRPDLLPHPPRPLLPGFSLLQRQVVDLGDITAGTVEEDNLAPAHAASNCAAHPVYPVGGGAGVAGGAVAGEIDDAAEELALGTPGSEYADLRVDWPGRPHDVRIALARMRRGDAVFHDEAAVEGDRRLRSSADREQRISASAPCLDGGCGDLSRYVFEVAHVRRRSMLPREVLT